MNRILPLISCVLLLGLGACALKNACVVATGGTNVSCVQYTGTAYIASTSQIETACTTATGTLGTSCPTASSYGSCKLLSGQATEVVYRYYTGDKSAQQTVCTSARGSWTSD